MFPTMTATDSGSSRRGPSVLASPRGKARPGPHVNAETKQPFTYADPCVERGVTIAYDAQAHAQAQAAVAEIVKTSLLSK